MLLALGSSQVVMIRFRLVVMIRLRLVVMIRLRLVVMIRFGLVLVMIRLRTLVNLCYHLCHT